jgi:hypothetical protein
MLEYQRNLRKGRKDTEDMERDLRLDYHVRER